MKTVFLHNMTDQMVAPTFAISEDVKKMSHYDESASPQTINQLVDNIQQNGNTITQILNNLINLSEKEMEQEKGGEL
jgi:methyl-accepting chemotaxis protein